MKVLYSQSGHRLNTQTFCIQVLNPDLVDYNRQYLEGVQIDWIFQGKGVE